MRGILAAAVLCMTSAAFAAPLTFENGYRNVNRAIGVTDPAQYHGQWESHKYTPSPEDWRKIAVYQVITDRFRDGDPINNEGKFGGYSPGEIHLRHGGDFAGLTDKLDYIKGLGFDAIWISPVFQNMFGSPAGYGQIDFTLLDDRFGTLEELRKLVNEAHRRGMYVIVDVVVNHLSYLYYAEGYKETIAPFRMHTGEYRLLPRFPDKTYADFRIDNNFKKEGAFCDVYGHDGKKYLDRGEGSFWESDLHHNGGLTDYYDPWNNTLGTIYSSYDDLRLCSPRVQAKILAMTKSLISSTDIDGIRIDTPMQVPLEFLKRWTPAVKEHAVSLGKKNFFMFGETYCPPRKCATMIGRGKTPDMYGKADAFIDQRRAMDSGIDYGFYGTFVKDLFRELKPVKAAYFKEFLKANEVMFDLYDPETKATSQRMLLFYGSHDQRRLAALPQGIARARLAALMTIFWPGIPIMYQGDEQDFSSHGIALDGHTREDMMTSIAWADHPAAFMPNKVSSDNFDMAGATYLYIQQLMELRSSFWELLAADKIEILWAIPRTRGTALSFAREGRNGERLQVILNISDEESVLGAKDGELLSICSAKCSLKNLLKPGESLEAGEKGSLAKLTLAPFEGKLLYAGSVPAEAPRVEELKPAHDQVIPAGKHSITLRFSVPMNPESVRTAVRFNRQKLEKSRFTAADNTTFKIDADVFEGINSLEVTGEARSAGNRALSAPFSARFRSGSPRNVLVESAAKASPALINGGDQFAYVPHVTIHHAAKGAHMFRIKNEPNGVWSIWEPYKERSDWSIDGTGPGWREVTVQYWADGSSAYYAKDGIDYVLSDGIPITGLSSYSDAPPNQNNPAE